MNKGAIRILGLVAAIGVTVIWWLGTDIRQSNELELTDLAGQLYSLEKNSEIIKKSVDSTAFYAAYEAGRELGVGATAEIESKVLDELSRIQYSELNGFDIEWFAPLVYIESSSDNSFVISGQRPFKISTKETPEAYIQENAIFRRTINLPVIT